ncbi:MAG TPA: dTDP-4-dehydrorhamnose 3,5-epimerase [Caulobacteraceae bacterium]
MTLRAKVEQLPTGTRGKPWSAQLNPTPRQALIVTPTPIAGVLLIEPQVFSDERGFFQETWKADAFAAVGIPGPFVQDNHSRSLRGVLRGLHFQSPRAQGKLLRVSRGTVFDVVVDIRRDSPGFGTWFGTELSGDNHKMLWSPPGMAHGFLTLSDEADFLYKCTDVQAPSDERVIRWNDPDLAIAWPVRDVGRPRLSARDAAAPSLAEALGAR